MGEREREVNQGSPQLDNSSLHQLKGLLYAYFLIPYRSQPTKRARLVRSSTHSILLALDIEDCCRQYGGKPISPYQLRKFGMSLMLILNP